MLQLLDSTIRLASLVKTQCNDPWVNEGQVEWRKIQISISDGDEHSSIDRRVCFVHISGRLVSKSGIVASNSQRGVSKVELRDPSDISRLAGDRADGGDIAEAC